MVADHNTVHTQFHSLFRVCNTLYSLQTKRLATTNLPPLLHQPRHLLPAPSPPMPHVINPHRARLVRLLLGVDSSLLQSLLKYRVRQPKISTNAMIERVVRFRLIMMSPCQLPCIECEYAGREAAFICSRQKGDREFVIVRHVKLEESRAFAVRSTDVFDGIGACGREAVRQIQFLRDLGDWEFAEGVVDLVDTYWGEANGCADFVAEDRGLGVAFVGVDEHARDDSVAVEGLSICEVGVGLASIRGGIIPATWLDAALYELWFDVPSCDCQAPLGKVLEVPWLGTEWRKFSRIIFPKELSLIEGPLRGVSALDIGVLRVRHDDSKEMRN
jgi:hypothetical protein